VALMRLTGLRRLVIVLACAGTAAAAAAQCVAAPKPQAAPRRSGAQLRPIPAPVAPARSLIPSVKSARSQPVHIASVPKSSPTVPKISLTYSSSSTPVEPTSGHAQQTRSQSRQQKPPKARATAKRSVGRRAAAALDKLRPLPKSGESWFLLAVGLGLVLLVVGETTFLAVVGPHFGFAVRRRRPRRVPAAEPAIRRVLLRR